MKLRQLLEKQNKDHNFALIVHASIKAYKSLSSNSKRIINDWQRYNWNTGALEKGVQTGSDELNEINKAFLPVKQLLKQKFGHNITLYRGQRNHSESDIDKNRKLFSWSYDKNVAAEFAHEPLYKETSDGEIARAVEQYNKKGFVKFRGYIYLKSKRYPNSYNIYKASDKDFITDGDDLEHDLKSNQQDTKSLNDSRRKQGSVITRKIDIDKIIWITNQLNSKEFIVALNPLIDQ